MKKHTMRTILVCLLLLTAMILSVACGDKKNQETETQPVDLGAIVAGNEGCVFTIIYPTKWTDEEYNGAKKIGDALKEKYQSSPAVKSDSLEAADGAYEILVGKTNRAESAQAVENLNEYGWTITVIGNRIVINAKNNLMISDAVDHFINANVGDAEKLGINTVQVHTYNQETYTSSHVLSVGGRTVYTVAYSERLSDYLKGAVMNFTSDMRKNGVSVTSKSGTVSQGKAVTLTTSSSVKGWEILFEDDGNITIKGETDAMAVNALNYFAENVMKKDSEGDIVVADAQKISDAAEKYDREGWLLAAPAYDGGVLSQRLYDSGLGLNKDNGSASSDRTYMMSVKGSSHIEFGEYLEKLAACGYEIDSQNSMSTSGGKTNRYYGFKKGYQYLYVYFLAETNEVRVIDDRASVLESEFEYTFEYDENTGAEIYMYGMKHDAVEGGNGAFNIIKQADNTVILVDGGSYTQATPEAVAGLMDFLRQITNKTANEKIVISCWFITHPHEDHGSMVTKLITTYKDKVDLQRVMFNFPTDAEVDFDIYPYARDGILDYFPNAKVMKCHTGQSIQLGSVVLDVMTTHEDAVDAYTQKTKMTEGNSSSTVVRITLPDGTRFMNLGDYTQEMESAFLKMYSASELKCEITDVAHHGYNDVGNIYRAISAEYALWSNYSAELFTDWKEVRARQVRGYLMEAGASAENIFYAGLNTVKLECKGGTIQVTKQPVVY